MPKYLIHSSMVKWAKVINGLTCFTLELFLLGKVPGKVISGLENKGRVFASVKEFYRLIWYGAARKV